MCGRRTGHTGGLPRGPLRYRPYGVGWMPRDSERLEDDVLRCFERFGESGRMD